jgi:hypothetical protein
MNVRRRPNSSAAWIISENNALTGKAMTASDTKLSVTWALIIDGV